MDETTPTPPAPMSTSPPMPLAAPTAEITSAQADTMIGWIKADLLAGKITQEDATRAFGQLNATEAQLAPDTRSDAVRALDQQFPPGKPEDFLIHYDTPGQPFPQMTPEMKRFDDAARGWLAEAGFPVNMGNSLVSTIAKVAKQTQDMSPDELIAFGESEYVKLLRVYGGEDNLQEKLRDAAVMIQEIERIKPGLQNLLRSKGVGDSALVVVQLIGQSEHWHARRKGR